MRTQIPLVIAICGAFFLLHAFAAEGDAGNPRAEAGQVEHLGIVTVDDYTGQVSFQVPADDGKSYRVTVAISKPWKTPGIEGDRIDVWLLARGGKALTINKQLQGEVLLEAGSRGATASAIFSFDRTVERHDLSAVVVAVDGQPKVFKIAQPGAGVDKKSPLPSTPKPRADGLPVGQWDVTLSNGTTGRWSIKQDEASSVVRDTWSFGKQPVAQDGAFVLRYDDGHVERWTRAGERMVVEHWSAAAEFPSKKPVLGIAAPRGQMHIKDGVVVGNVTPDQFVTSMQKRISAKGPTFVMEVYRLESFSNFHYRIDVCNESRTLVLQSVEFRDEIPLEDDENAFQITDMDRDGSLDIQVLGGQQDGKAWYKVWRYEAAKGQFVWSESDTGERSSDLKGTLDYELSVIDKHKAWRADGLDKVLAIEGPANEYMVRLQATPKGKLQDLFGATLTIKGNDGLLIQVPLETKTRFASSDDVWIQFLIDKRMIADAMLTLRCGTPLQETKYDIQFKDHAPRQGK